MLQGWLQIALFLAVLVALTPLLGGYMARVYTGERVFLAPVLGPLERLIYRVLRVDPRAGRTGRPTPAALLVFSGALLARALPDPAHPDAAPVQPAGLPLRHLGRDLQHRLVVRHEHELAVLRRRDDDDRTSARWPGWRCRTSSRPRVGIVRRDRADPRHRRRARRTQPRQLLVGPRRARCSTCCCRSRSSARSCSSPRARSRPSRATHRAHARRRHAVDRARPGRLAGDHQGARHQRRRLLQRQLGACRSRTRTGSRTSSRCWRSC